MGFFSMGTKIQPLKNAITKCVPERGSLDLSILRTYTCRSKGKATAVFHGERAGCSPDGRSTRRDSIAIG
jgi:hypothetical protein